MNKELELQIANHIFKNCNFTLEDIEKERVALFIDTSMTDLIGEEVVKLVCDCYEKFGEDRQHYVAVFREEEGFYITTDEEEALTIDEKKWVHNFCYHIVEIDECVKKYDDFIDDDCEYEYLIEFSQI